MTIEYSIEITDWYLSWKRRLQSRMGADVGSRFGVASSLRVRHYLVIVRFVRGVKAVRSNKGN